MAVKNSLAPAPAQNTTITTYRSNGEDVNLSPGIIRKYLVAGGGAVTDSEVMMFLSLCRFQHLNPFLREAYLIKYGDKSPATMVVGKDVFVKRAMKNPDFKGFEAGIIVLNEEGVIEERPGTFYLKDREELVGGWARVFMKNLDFPFYESVTLEEYEGRTKEGKPNSQWATKGATMIRKVALMHVLREAFPDDTAGMYIQEEIPEAQAIVLPEAPIEIPEAAVQQQEAPAQEPAELSAASALFGE